VLVLRRCHGTRIVDCVVNLSAKTCDWPAEARNGQVLLAVNGAAPGAPLPPFAALLIEGN
jgi:hypothetical protein